MGLGCIALGVIFVATVTYGQVVTRPGTDFSGQRAEGDPSNLVLAPTDAEIRRWLQSDDPRLTAWGAHYALDQGRAALLPVLEEVVDRWGEDRGKAIWDQDHLNAVGEVLDAIIAMHGTLSPRVIELALGGSQYGYLDAPLAVLLLRLPANEAEPVWEKIIFTGDIQGGIQRIAADILLLHPPAGFAARLIGGLVESGEVTVADPGVRVGRGNGGSYPGGCGARMGSAKKDWPKVGVYALLDTPTESGSTLLVNGIDSVYINRLVVPIDQSSQIYVCASYGLTTFTGLNEARRLRLVRSLLHGREGELTVDLSPQLSIEFRTAALYRSQMDGFVHRQLAQFALLTTELSKAGLVTEDERRRLRLCLQIAVSDCRKVPDPALPVFSYGPDVSILAVRSALR